MNEACRCFGKCFLETWCVGRDVKREWFERAGDRPWRLGEVRVATKRDDVSGLN